MKKLILSLAFAMAAAVSFAQTFSRKPLPILTPTFGIRGALNLSMFTNYGSTTFGNTTTTSSASSGTLPGFAVGIFVESPVTPDFAITPELDYSLKGGEDKNNSHDKVELGYIALPILFKWTPAEAKGLNIGLGPEFDYLVSAKSKLVNGSTTSTTDIKDQFKTFDFGIAFGAGYDFIPSLGIDIRYDLGLVNTSKTAGTQTGLGYTSSTSVKNRTFQLGLRYLFGR